MRVFRNFENYVAWHAECHCTTYGHSNEHLLISTYLPYKQRRSGRKLLMSTNDQNNNQPEIILVCSCDEEIVSVVFGERIHTYTTLTALKLLMTNFQSVRRSDKRRGPQKAKITTTTLTQKVGLKRTKKNGGKPVQERKSWMERFRQGCR